MANACSCLSMKLALACALFASAQAHSILTRPAPRVDMGSSVLNVGVKKTPFPASATAKNGCAKDSAGTDSTLGRITAVYAPGSKVAVTWDSNIPHPSAPGVRIAIRDLSKNEQFSDNILVDGQLTDDNGVAVGSGTGAEHTFTVTLTAGKTCECCQLQLIWESEADNGFYLDCADIRITADTTIPATPFLENGPVCPGGTTPPKIGEEGFQPVEESAGGSTGFVVFAILLVIGAAGAWVYMRRKQITDEHHASMPSVPAAMTEFTVIADFAATEPTHLSARQGAKVLGMTDQDTATGWVYVSCDGKEGFVPKSFLQGGDGKAMP